MKLKNRIPTLLLVIILGIGMMPETVNAETAFSLADGNIDITESGNYYIVGASTQNIITVTGSIDGDVNITLTEVSIDVSGSNNACAFSIGAGSNVNLTLIGANVLKSGSYQAGLHVPEGAALTVTEASTGLISAEGGVGGTGIGGNYGGSGGTVNIIRGTVTARGKSGGAGIGGGAGVAGSIGIAGTINLPGGRGGNGGDGCTVNINGGIVTAVGDDDNVGIGGGRGGNGGIGGISKGNGGRGGNGGNGGTLNISGGMVTADDLGSGSGGNGGAGSIGLYSATGGSGGNGGDGGTVNISGGTVTVTDICGGSRGKSGNMVRLFGNKEVNGFDGNYRAIIVSGGTVHASSVACPVYNDDMNREYLTIVTVPDISSPTDVTYTVDEGTPVSCLTDENGKLYLWLPVKEDSAQTDIRIVLGNSVFQASGTMPAGPISLTATAVQDVYSITYQLNGGTVSTANPASYTVESAAITLNAPTRSGCSFLGWTGSNGTMAQTNVSIPTGSTGNNTYTANWKADKPSAPDASIVTAKTDTSLTITMQSGYEYSVDGTNWYSGTGSYTFTGLEQNKAYNLVCRKAAVATGNTSAASDASEALSVTNNTAALTAPAAPTIGTGADKPTSDCITINTAAGNEYYISTSNTPPTTWPSSGNEYFKATGTDTHTFTGLTAGTKYYIHVRVAETDDAMPSASVSTAQYTLPATPLASVVNVNYASETINFANTYEVSGSADFNTTIASGDALQPNTTYYVRVKAANGAPASESVSFTVSSRPEAPTAGDAPSVPSVSAQTDHSITIDTVAGCQYTITTSDTAPTIWGAAETSTGTKTFSSLSATTRYYIWVRVGENATAMPSDSRRISVYTASTVPSAEGYTIDYSAEIISYDDGIYEVTADSVALPLIIIGDGDSITDNISDYGEAAQKIYVRVKAVEDGAPAGAWVEVTLPARPVTPSAGASDETADNKNDGRISGVTEEMEWKIAGGAYAAVTADQESNGISGLSDGTYYVRYMAASGTGFKSDEQEITINAGNTITVTFNSQSGSAVDAITGKAYGGSITAPADPVRSGFYFAGWYKDASYTNPWTFTLDTLTGHITLFAKWSAIPAYTVTGRILDDTSHAVEGATVRMMQGTTQFGTTGITDPYGDFTIDKVPPGIYNLVITKGTKTAIIKVEVSSGNVAIGNATLPSGNANSILVVNGSDTPNVVVGGLDSEAGAQLEDSSNPHTDKVDITLTVEKKDASTAPNGGEVTGTVTAAGKQVGMILAIDVRKTVNETEDTSYNQTSGIIEINIPLPAELQGKATYAIYRYHGTSVDTITETPNADLERIVVDRTNWTITLYARKFSTYAIGYTNPSSGDGGRTAAAGTPAAIIESPKTGALPYYVENGKVIFIGLALDADGTMKYTAPAGVTVLFRENPKDFSDIAGHWAKSNIDFVTERELFLGTGDDEFSPQSGMTRAMFATVIGRLYERSYGEILQKDGNNFTDIDNDSYYAAYIDWASENNIISGIGGGLFKPDREITRQEMAAILYRFAEFLNVLSSDSEKTQLNYPDAEGISSWATEAAGYCQQTGIITGRLGGNFVPQGTATRAEVATILQRFIESSVK